MIDLYLSIMSDHAWKLKSAYKACAIGRLDQRHLVVQYSISDTRPLPLCYGQTATDMPKQLPKGHPTC